MKREQKLMQGNEAIAHGAFFAGARFYAGYPITPSSEIAEICSREMPKIGGMYMQMEDEVASMAAIVGASLAGKKSFTATSGPGFSLMQENLGMAIMGEVPLVVVNVQRSGPSTGLATKPAQSDVMQIRWGRHGDQDIIALVPSSVKECFDLTVTAFNFSEKYRVPVVLAPDEIVGHMRENITIPSLGEMPVIDRVAPAVGADDYHPFCFDDGCIAPLAAYGGPHLFHITSSMHGEDGYSNSTPANATRRVAQLHSKLSEHRDDIVRTRTFDTEECDILVVATGAVVRAARSAAIQARTEGLRVGVIQLITLWPFPGREIQQASLSAKAIVVPEMNYSGQIAGEMLKYVSDPHIVKRMNSFNGQIITPRQILQSIQANK